MVLFKESVACAKGVEERAQDIIDMGKEEQRFQEGEKIYIKRNSSSGRLMDVKRTAGGRTLLKSPVKSDTKGSSWKRAFKK